MQKNNKRLKMKKEKVCINSGMCGIEGTLWRIQFCTLEKMKLFPAFLREGSGF